MRRMSGVVLTLVLALLVACAEASTNSSEINQTGTSFTLLLTGADACTFTGQYTQTGKLGLVQGNYSCGSGEKGTFEVLEMTPTISGFTGRVNGPSQSCRWQGYPGAIRRTS